jgi:hypothetical protein
MTWDYRALLTLKYGLMLLPILALALLWTSFPLYENAVAQENEVKPRTSPELEKPGTIIQENQSTETRSEFSKIIPDILRDNKTIKNPSGVNGTTGNGSDPNELTDLQGYKTLHPEFLVEEHVTNLL